MTRQPLTPDAIRMIWKAQNPTLVLELQTNGLLAARLAEAHELATLVQADAIDRGMSPEQARELAQDAVSLQTSTA